jgi:hypothetical protein
MEGRLVAIKCRILVIRVFQLEGWVEHRQPLEVWVVDPADVTDRVC